MEVDSVGIIARLSMTYITTRVVKTQTIVAKIPRVPVENQITTLSVVKLAIKFSPYRKMYTTAGHICFATRAPLCSWWQFSLPIARLTHSATAPPSHSSDPSSKNSVDRHAKSSYTKSRFECNVCFLLVLKFYRTNENYQLLRNQYTKELILISDSFFFTRVK